MDPSKYMRTVDINNIDIHDVIIVISDQSSKLGSICPDTNIRS